MFLDNLRSLKVLLPYFKTSGTHHCRDVTAGDISGQKYSFVFNNVSSKMVSRTKTIFKKLNFYRVFKSATWLRLYLQQH